MGNAWKCTIMVLVLAVGTFLTGCGGGGSSVEPLPAKILQWEPPATYTDGSALSASTDLASFEIYLREDVNFSEDDQPGAALAAINPATGEVTTSFNLANLAPYISKGVTYHVSIRAVAQNGFKSDFSPSAVFSY